MPKYICSECGKILIRNADHIRRSGAKSYCVSKGAQATLTRLKIRPRRTSTELTELELLARKPDEEIDTSDIPELPEGFMKSRAVRIHSKS